MQSPSPALKPAELPGQDAEEDKDDLPSGPPRLKGLESMGAELDLEASLASIFEEAYAQDIDAGVKCAEGLLDKAGAPDYMYTEQSTKTLLS